MISTESTNIIHITRTIIKSIGIAEAPKFSLSLMQESASKGIKSSLIFAMKFIIIMNEEEVEEEQLYN